MGAVAVAGLSATGALGIEALVASQNNAIMGAVSEQRDHGCRRRAIMGAVAGAGLSATVALGTEGLVASPNNAIMARRRDAGVERLA